jgi:heat shock protein HslJ
VRRVTGCLDWRLTAGDSLDFGPVISTKIACADGDELERRFVAALDGVTHYQVADSMLTLSGPGGALAHFRAAAADESGGASAKP